jgi:cytochrome c-type biogenesis protein CcmH/NrfG
VGLLPVIGIIQVGSQAHADRYTYWVGCGVASAAMLVVLTLAPRIRAVVLAAAACVVVALIPPALRQCGTWSTSAALYEHAFRETGSAWSAFSLGESHVRSDPARAEFYYRAAIADRPEDESLAALAVLLAVKPGNGDLAEPRACAEASLKINPKNWRAWEALGFVGMRTKDFPLAARAFSEALKNGSDNPMVERLAVEAAQRARPGPWRN